MDAAHIHLLLNHVPVLGTIFALVLLGYGTVRGSDDVVKASLWTLGVVGLAAVAVYLTGEPAEELVEGLPGVSEAVLERHEEAALWATLGGGAVGALAFLGLFLYRGATVPRRFAGGVLVATLALTGVMGWTANLGGQVRHTEIRAGAAADAGGTAPGSDAAGEEEREEAEVGVRLPARIAAPPAG